jgi:RHS repeat-associated protein
LCEAGGRVAWSAKYNAFGEASALAAPGVSNPVRFPGQYYDDETGLCYNRYRYYDPRVGAFISPDPAGLLAGHNLTAYAPNPWTWIDPLGLNCTAGANFKDHFLRHKALLERLLGKKYPKWSATHGAEFLQDIDKLIADGTLTHVGQGTLKKGQPPMNIFRGQGLTLVTKPGGEFVTLLESGKGLDKGIQMLPGQLTLPGMWP